ncbi:MAG: GNAT family N-acetyltransferase [Chloroflexi bacterium]|nr:GNAT family N-acetyltransferase [Chloroflexota bacterium]
MSIHGPYGWWAARSVENMREWLGQPNLHPEQDLFLAFDGPRAVGYLQNSFEPPLARVVLEGAVHSEYHRRGIGARLVEASVALATDRGYQVVQMAVPYGALNARRLALKTGFRFIRKFWEMRLKDPSTVPAPEMPAPFVLRHFTEGDDERLRYIQNLSFSKHWGFSPNTLEEVSYRTRMGLFRFDDILLVTDGDKTVGFNWTRLDAGPRDITGYIGMMGAHPDYRGKGLGTAVMRAGVDYLRGKGAARIDLTVDSLNPSAHRIYRAGGFERQAVTVWYEKMLKGGA